MVEKDKRYYWLKLKRDFFKRHDIQIIESMPNGKDYILFYLKLLCESVDHEGNLRFNEQIPYSEQMLSTITNTNIDIVRSAIKVFTELQMMELLDDGTYFMHEVEKMLGSETYWAEQKRIQRQKVDNVQLLSNVSPTCPSKSKIKSNSIDIELDIDTEEDKEKEKEIILSNSNELDCRTQDVQRALEAWNELGVYGIQTVKKLKSQTQRYSMLQARIKEYGIDDVLTAIENVKSSDFLQGKHNGKPWQITFDWFVRPNNFPKVLEGNYSGSGQTGNNQYRSQTAQMLESHYNMVDDWVRKKEMEVQSEYDV